MRGWWLVVGALVGCDDGGGDGKDGGPADTSDTGPIASDADGDGSPAGEDCDDADPSVHPGQDEVCDGVDSDCDPATGEPTGGAVGVPGVGAFASIGEAVAAAPAGGAVHVCGGAWDEVVVVDKELSLIGHDRPTIDAQGLGAAIELSGGTARVEGFAITGGTGSPSGPRPTNGGGIDAYAATGPVDVVDCEVFENLADLGGGILFGPEGGTLVDTVVRDNVAGLYGGGVYATGDVDVSGSELSDNVANDNGGGLVVGDGAIVTITDTRVERNTANAGGGLFSFEDGQLDATGSTVLGNRATAGGGGIWLENAELTGGVVEDNDGGLLGGGVYAADGSVVSFAAIRSNTAESGAGLTANGAVDLVSVTIEENSAIVRGGGVYAFDADVFADDTTAIRGNDAPQSGGGVWMLASSWTGGSVTENEADEGGGFYLSSDGTNANTLAELEIADNTAVTSGGGVFAGSPFSATGLDLLRNLALDRGGGLYTSFEAVGTVEASTLTSNSAVQRGGGLYANTASTVTLSSTTLDRNVALRGAGMYIIAESTLTLRDCVVEANGDATTISGGGARVTAGVLVSIGSDWAAGATDNVPDDVYDEGGGPYLGYETDETFTCDEYACVPAP